MSRSRRALGFVMVALFVAAPRTALSAGSSGPRWCATTSADREAVWAHREQQGRRSLARTSTARNAAYAVGQVAVILDEGDLALLRSPLDLQSVGLRFSPVDGGFSVSRVDMPIAPASGTALPLGDDDTRSVDLPFAFPYFGTTYTQVFVNSDGNLTFREGDGASTSRTVGRLVTGPPRVAPLFADLDPTAGGTVTAASDASRFSVTWSGVPQFGESDRNSFSVTLHADGRVDFAYGSDLTAAISEGVVGLGPGGEQGGVTAVDFSTAAGVTSGGTLAQSFRGSDSLDTVALARKFYRAFPDEFVQLVVYSNRRLTERGTFAYEQTVRNDVTGIGTRLVDSAQQYGSAGRLESFVYMDDITKYPEQLDLPFLGADTTLSVLAHEVGHRFLASAVFRDGDRDSQELLGRDQAHWSFFMDSDGSHDEGNEILDTGGGTFRTGAASVRFGPLDQYLMGLRGADEVPPVFVVRSPGGTGSLDTGRDPEAGVTFTGTRRDVTVGELQAAMGPRNPPVEQAPKEIRQAFVIVGVGAPPTPAEIDKVERIRAAWPAYYNRSTDGRGTADARLQ